MNNELEALRAIISEADKEIAGLYARRMEAAAGIAALKRREGMPVLDAQREQAVISSVRDSVPEDLRAYITEVYRTVMATSRAYQKQLMDGGRPEEDRNLMLIGMPGCGKTTIGRALAERTGRPYVSTDHRVTVKAGLSIPEIFERYGEAAFRKIEHEVLEEVSGLKGHIIATGGGIVTVPENLPLLHVNSEVVFLIRDLKELEIAGRPISLTRPVEELYAERLALYVGSADMAVANTSVDTTADLIIRAMGWL